MLTLVLKRVIVLALLAGTTIAVGGAMSEAEEANRYQAVPGEVGREPSGPQAVRAPGVWILDTKYGRVAFCEYVSGFGEPTVTEEGWTVREETGEKHVSCTAFAIPKRGPWDKYQTSP